MSNPVLKLENVTMQFGGVVAVDNLSMEVGEGEIVALIGHQWLPLSRRQALSLRASHRPGQA